MPVQEQLWALHLVDANLRGLRSRLDAASHRHTAQQRKLEQFQRQADELQAEHKQAQAQAANRESEASQMDQRIGELRERMNNVTSNKEYSALLVEVNTLKADKSKLEDQSLDQLQRVEDLGARLEAIREQANQQQKLVDGATREVAEAGDEIAERLAELEKEREATAQPLPTDARQLYEKLAASFEGEALAEIEEQDRRRMEYSCGACYTRIPIERVNAALTNADAVVTCPACDRILIAKDKLRDELAASN